MGRNESLYHENGQSCEKTFNLFQQPDVRHRRVKAPSNPEEQMPHQYCYTTPSPISTSFSPISFDLLPPLNDFWDALPEIFTWMTSGAPVPQCAIIQHGAGELRSVRACYR